ncbi:MAG: uroporphyrinogen-III synthase [Labilithrix sp.]|nr:uroporphyrinogen-III synthase [Labilithrix sp.]MCW5813035.1 uroporphyrinogen-III synthase [Labilithrix sp.]
MEGKVTFVGAGTGDPRLLTVRAVEVLESADYVLFDPEVHPDVLGRLPEGTPRHPVQPPLTPERVAQMLATEAKAGRHAVRIMWADPLFFGHGDVEGLAVARHEVPIEVVPGIGPLIAVGAFAGAALTRTSDASPSVAAVSVTRGHETLHEWDKLALATDTLAIVCDADSIAETARSLVFYGRPPSERVTIVENVSLPTQTVTDTTLSQVPLLPRIKASRAVVVVGDRAARLRELSWLERTPLFGRRILVTRAKEQATKTAALLREKGADPVVVPTIEIHPPPDPAPVVDAVTGLDRYDWVVLTSANGVEKLWAEIARQGKDARAFGRAKIAAIGPGTAAALAGHGLTADLVPREHKGEGLAAELLRAIGDANVRVLLARARVARDVVPDALKGAGHAVDVVAVYETKSPPRPLIEALAALLEGEEIDAVTFTSSSTVEHLVAALEDRAVPLLANTCVASIGPITTETAERLGIRVDVTADTHTVPGLVAAIEAHFAGLSDLALSGMRRVSTS